MCPVYTLVESIVCKQPGRPQEPLFSGPSSVCLARFASLACAQSPAKGLYELLPSPGWERLGHALLLMGLHAGPACLSALGWRVLQHTCLLRHSKGDVAAAVIYVNCKDCQVIMERTVACLSYTLTTCGQATGQHKHPGHLTYDQQPAGLRYPQSMYNTGSVTVFYSAWQWCQPHEVICEALHHMGAQDLQPS